MLSIKKMLTKILQELAALQTSSTTTYASGTVGSDSVMQNANLKNCKLVKTGKNVRCYVGIGYANGTTAIPKQTTMFTIPAGYRPPSRKMFPAVGFRSGSKAVIGLQLEFNADGTITHNSGDDITILYGSAEWETN